MNFRSRCLYTSSLNGFSIRVASQAFQVLDALMAEVMDILKIENSSQRKGSAFS